MSENKEVPQIKQPEWLVPNYPPLKIEDATGQAAVEGQMWHYPRVVRTMVDPPISGQKIGCLSFLLFKEPRKFQNGKPVYGYVKLRGNWADESQGKFEASKIIREIDSKYPIRLTPVGAWVPITEDDSFDREKLDVKTNSDEICLRDQAVKEKEAEQRRIMREIREREEEAKSGDIYDDRTSLTYYSMRRVTELRLMEARENLIRQLDSYKTTLRKVQKETKCIEREHPEYIDLWVDCYNIERRKAGIPNYVPSEEQEKEHNDATFEDSDNETETN